MYGSDGDGDRDGPPAGSTGNPPPRLWAKHLLMAIVELWFPRAAFAGSGSARRAMIAVTAVFGVLVAVVAFSSGRTVTGVALLVAFVAAVAVMIAAMRHIERKPRP